MDYPPNISPDLKLVILRGNIIKEYPVLKAKRGAWLTKNGHFSINYYDGGWRVVSGTLSADRFLDHPSVKRVAHKTLYKALEALDESWKAVPAHEHPQPIRPHW